MGYLNVSSMYMLCSTIVCDGVCIKHNNNKDDFGAKELEDAKRNYSNILIEDQEGVEIYCSEKMKEAYEDVMRKLHLKETQRLYITGFIKIFSK